ncbi:MAG: EamA family transporter [Planctomycetota bacterium]
MSLLRASRVQVLLAFAAVYVIWGSTYLAIRYAIETMPPFLMAGARFSIAGAGLYAFARARGAVRPELRHWRSAAIAGVLLLLGGNGAVVWSELRVPSGAAALLVATVPLWIVVLESLRAGGTRPSRSVIIGIVLGLAGLVLLVGPGNIAGHALDPLGASVLLLGTLAWSAGSLYVRGAKLPASPFLSVAMEMLCGGAALLLLGLVTGEPWHLQLERITPRSLLALGYLIVFGALVAFTSYVWLLKASTPARVATYAYVNPVVAVLLGWWLAGEALTARMVVASAVIVIGVAVTTTPPGVWLRRKRRPSVPFAAS